MNLKKMLEAQAELDKTIFDKAGIKEYPLEKVKLSLLTEIGELANEVQCHKYWKKNKNIDRNKVLEEFADCLHFALSLENHFKQIADTPLIKQVGELITQFAKEAKEKGLKNDLTHNFLATNSSVIENDYPILSVLTLGISLNITPDKMEQAYYRKNKINYQRQQEGY